MAQKILVQESDTPIQCCGRLESGNILFFPTVPFDFPPEEISFLLEQKQSGSKSRKNIAYKPQLDKITNHGDTADAPRLLEVLRNYSRRVTVFLSTLLAPYAPYWKHDYASFRPFQEQGRKLRLRARNDLLHVDAFPTRPLHGMRILRFFTNINPTEGRKWITSEPFEMLAKKFGEEVSYPKSVGYSAIDRLRKKMGFWLQQFGFKVPMRSPYDQFMLRLHHFLKENSAFQQSCPKDYWDFPPGSCWAVFTDQVSHAAISGQYALEQTFLVPQRALIYPERAPVAILERLSGKNMVDPELIRS